MENSSTKKTWEEDMYWNNFNFAHFSRILPSDFHHRIALPKKFTDYMKTNLPEQMVLNVNGLSWNVNLEKGNNEIIFHGDGWEEFVNAYALKKNDLLVFKYNRRECFEVLIFDRENLCEKESSYFVRKGQQKNSNVNNHEEDHGSNEKTKERSSKKLTDTSQEDCGFECTPRKRNDLNDQCELDTSSVEEIVIFEDAEITPKNAANKTRDGEGKFTSMVPNDVWKETGTKLTLPLSQAKKTTPTGSSSQWCYKSNRREVTEEEITKAHERAKKTSTKFINSFIVVMRPSSVYTRFYLTIPADWKKKNKLKIGQEVTLRIEEKTWVCIVSNTGRSIGFQGVSWKTFVRDNLLEEFDVCLFVPSSSTNGSYVLDICIFRVVPQVFPRSSLK